MNERVPHYLQRNVQPQERKEPSRKMRAALSNPDFVAWKDGRKDFIFDDESLNKLLKTAEINGLLSLSKLPNKARLDAAWDIAKILQKYYENNA